MEYLTSSGPVWSTLSFRCSLQAHTFISLRSCPSISLHVAGFLELLNLNGEEQSFLQRPHSASDLGILVSLSHLSQVFSVVLSSSSGSKCPTLCYPIVYAVHGILQARILE